ncbi:MAG: hypothetical protein SPL83_02255 [Succinivibrio sp.]|nr:hypothetical protein [Succinivibrio sp.]
MNKFEKQILFLKILLKLEEKKNLSKVEIFSIGLLACVILLFLMFLWRN